MKQKILIIDDDMVTLRLFKNNLEDDFDVITENSGLRFAESMDSYEADLILLDLEMPVFNGRQVYEKIKQNPKFKDIPVIYISGMPDPLQASPDDAGGVCGVINKTASKEELGDKITKALENSRGGRTSGEILILCDDTARLKSMRDSLEALNYRTRLVRNIFDAVKYIKSGSPDLFIIGRDMYGIEPQSLYDEYSTLFRRKSVRCLVMGERFFDKELEERVKNAMR